MHFTKPEQLEKKFTQLEEKNLSRINMQVTIQNELDKVRSEYKNQTEKLQKQKIF
jgi:hypothetical protein